MATTNAESKQNETMNQNSSENDPNIPKKVQCHTDENQRMYQTLLQN